MLKYKIFDSQHITAFSTQRAGGVSVGTYASFNANHYCGDDPAHVTQNRTRLCRALGITSSQLVLPHQTHSTHVLDINPAFLQASAEEQTQLLEDIDAVITQQEQLCICVSTADCIPVLLQDPVRKVVAAIHAGWRGTCARIVEHTIQVMQATYGCNPSDLKAVIGPGISLDSFEIGDEVYQAFQEGGFPMDAIAKRYPAATGTKWHIDLWECNRLQLLGMGVCESQIEVSGICTYKEHEQYFSARRLGIKSGRILTGIMQHY